MFNMEGEVIGVNTAIISPTGGSIGIGFAVPSSTVTQVIDQLNTYGETRRGWLGVRIQTVNDEIAESLGLKKASGALVAAVTPEGPAAAAGIKVGDIILEFDGKDIDAMRQLPKLVAQTAIGKEVDIVVLRKGERKTVKAKIERMEEVAPAEPDADSKPRPKKPRKRSSLGLTLAAINSDMRNRYGIEPNVNGVVITDIDPDGPAADKEVRTGDVVVEVTHEKVRSPKELEARLEELRQLKRKSALLMLSDGHGELNFVAVGLGEE